MSVNIESLGRPEHEDGEEIGTRYKCDNKRQGESPRSLLQPAREHRKFGKFDLPNNEHHEERKSDDERGQNVSGRPGVLGHVSVTDKEKAESCKYLVTSPL